MKNSTFGSSVTVVLMLVTDSKCEVTVDPSGCSKKVWVRADNYIDEHVDSRVKKVNSD